MLRIIFFLVLPLFIFAQSSDWNSVVDLNLSVNASSRIDLYSNTDGNHILVDNGSTLKYYLYSPSGSQVRSYTVDGSISSTLSKVTGWDNTIYVSYKESSTIYSKISTNAGQTWSSIDNINMGDSDSDGLELWTDINGLHIVYSEWDDANEVYETKYLLYDPDEENWTNSKTVTDENYVTGNYPSVTTSTDRVHVAFIDDGREADTRDKYTTTWQSSQEVTDYSPQRISIVSTSAKLHALYSEYHGLPTYLLYKNRNLSGSTWSSSTLIASSSGLTENVKPDMAVTSDNEMHLVYGYISDLKYRVWDGSMSSAYTVMEFYSAPRISPNENDVYVFGITEDGSGGYELRMRQRDYAPAQLTNFDGSWSGNNPRIDWDESEAADFDEYIVQKKDGSAGSWTNYATISNRSTNYYIDNSEIKYTGGAYKDFVWYRVKQKDLEGNESPVTTDERFTIVPPQQNMIPVVSITEMKISDFTLDPNYPNPFNPSTKISFGLPELSDVSLKVYDLTGKEIATLAAGAKEEGYYDASFDGSDLTSGVYIYRFSAKGMESGKTFSQVKRMLLIK